MKHEEFLKYMKEKAENVTADCGDNSCRFVKNKTGMRTNGGCRCIEIRDPSLRHFTQLANPQAIIELLDRLERYREALRFYATAEYVDVKNRYGDPSDPDLEEDDGSIAREALEGGK